MLVKDWMTTPAITLEIHSTIQDAINALMEHHVNMMPVMENGKLVGVVSDRDVKHASPSDACLLDFQNIMYHVARIQVGDIMTSNPITVTEDFTIEETAEILMKNNISGVPVVNGDGSLKGVITQGDIFAALIALSGLSHRGVQFGFELEDRPGSIKEVADVIRDFSGRLVSIVSTYENCPEGYRHVYVRAFNLDREKMPDVIAKLKETAKVLYYVDHKSNFREFYY